MHNKNPQEKAVNLVPENRYKYLYVSSVLKIIINKHVIFDEKKTNTVITTRLKALCKKFEGCCLTSEDILNESLCIQDSFLYQADVKLPPLEGVKTHQTDH
jgi:hypothetical protein